MRPPIQWTAPLALAALAACGPAGTPRGSVPVPPEAIAAIDTATLMSHIRVLASDSFQGRGPGTAGEEKTVAYLQSQFQSLGLKPGNTDGSYIQKVPLVGITPDGKASLVFAKGGARRAPRWWHDLKGMEVAGKTLVMRVNDPPQRRGEDAGDAGQRSAPPRQHAVRRPGDD